MNPDSPDPKFQVLKTYVAQGRLDPAWALGHEIVNRYPDHAATWHLLGLIANRKGAHREAAGFLGRAIELCPDNPQWLCQMGIFMKILGNHQAASEYSRRALAINPADSDAWCNLGAALQDMGQVAEAEVCYRKALTLNPRQYPAYINLGLMERSRGRLQAAEACFKKALNINPRSVPALEGLGLIQFAKNRLAEAETCFRSILNIRSDVAPAWNNLGTVLNVAGRFRDALACYEQATRLNPDYVEAWYNKATACNRLGMMDTAIACYEKALALNPHHGQACSNLVHLFQQSCQWDRLEPAKSQLRALSRAALARSNPTPEDPFLSLMLDSDPEYHYQVAKSRSDVLDRLAGKKFYPRTNPSGSHPSVSVKPNLSGPITIGYLSGDFKNHPVGQLIAGILAGHDKQKCRIICYSYGMDDGSHVREQIRRNCHEFVDIRLLSDDEAAERIFNDKVDVLVDLAGFTKENRLGICARRPAPVQVAYLGFPATTGAGFMDYILTDEIVTPQNQQPFYAEKFIYLPHSYLAIDPASCASGSSVNRQQFGLPEHGVVFCSFNQAFKFEPIMFQIWMEILQQVPDSVLWLPAQQEILKQHLRQAVQRHGVSISRLIFAGKVPAKADHLARIALADICLDTRIFNGHSSTCDALLAGVPVITLPGNHFASRVSASLVTAAGLPQLIARDLADYQMKAIQLATNTDLRQSIRDALRTNIRHAPLFDVNQLTFHLETAYSEIRNRYLENRPPAPIRVHPMGQCASIR